MTLQSEAQTVLTKRLIKKIGDFSSNNPGAQHNEEKGPMQNYFSSKNISLVYTKLNTNIYIAPLALGP